MFRSHDAGVSGSSSGIVLPVLSSSNTFNAEEKVMAATGTYGFFNPITPISNSNNLRSDAPAPLIPPPSLISSTATTIPASSGHFFGSTHYLPATSTTLSSSYTGGFMNKPASNLGNSTTSSLLTPLMSIGTVGF